MFLKLLEKLGRKKVVLDRGPSEGNVSLGGVHPDPFCFLIEGLSGETFCFTGSIRSQFVQTVKPNFAEPRKTKLKEC